jgi:predicted GNAT family acetyltransferase
MTEGWGNEWRMTMQLLVQNNSRMQRYELPINTDAMAMAYYRMAGDKIVLTHTEVPFEYSGAGIGTKLADGVFALIRKNGQKVVPQCEFMAAYAAKHPEYNDLITG